MMLIATIDGGTTNTRVRIWRGEPGRVFTLAGEAVSETGVRNTAIDGNNHKLLATVDSLLRQAEEEAVRSRGEDGPGRYCRVKQDSRISSETTAEELSVSLILASGMLTSDLGLAEIPHIAAPADLPTLARSMVSRVIPGLNGRAVWFIPGIKNRPSDSLTEDLLSRMDMMRGEETEAAGLLAEFPFHPEEETGIGSRILVLPGSHNKYIAVDAAGQIRGCFTTLAGELLRSLTLDSILADSVGRGFAEHFDRASFLRGVEWGVAKGVGHGAFLCRICALFDHYSPLQAQNYLLGLLLADDLCGLREDPLFSPMLANKTACFMVAGRRVMQEAYCCLLEKEGYCVRAVPQETQSALSGKGALALARLRGLI